MAVDASYLIAKEISVASKPFYDGEFVKNCFLKAIHIVCLKKRQSFDNISLTRDTISDRISDLVTDRSINQGNVAFSVVIDESTDITDSAQLAILIREVDASLPVTEEFVQLVPMTGITTAEDIFGSLFSA